MGIIVAGTAIFVALLVCAGFGNRLRDDALESAPSTTATATTEPTATVVPPRESPRSADQAPLTRPADVVKVNPPPVKKAEPPKTESDRRVTKAGPFAAVSEAKLDEVTRYAIDKDYDAIHQLVTSGEVFVLEGGDEVFLVNRGFRSGYSGKVQFRRKGSMVTFWTIREALQE